MRHWSGVMGLLAATGLMLGGCGAVTSTARADDGARLSLLEPPVVNERTVEPPDVTSGEPLAAAILDGLSASDGDDGADAPAAAILLAQAPARESQREAELNEVDEEYDPWESFNER